MPSTVTAPTQDRIDQVLGRRVAPDPHNIRSTLGMDRRPNRNQVRAAEARVRAFGSRYAVSVGGVACELCSCRLVGGRDAFA
jgi:hypothetical protein